MILVCVLCEPTVFFSSLFFFCSCACRDDRKLTAACSYVFNIRFLCAPSSNRCSWLVCVRQFLFYSMVLVRTDDRSETATDADYERIEGVIGHEYFHNWTGNRVTCR